ncbi:acyl-CoA dehydrogenase family protein [Streptomyces pacificus]|uniref:Acyl-CoA/acyl-ACP dehydrogenase n=1 Tax=Streptomyces pacificus TaxID=2705029 RepID=A0A6A0B1W9_9ACTN|nr:acyl-CoA dehydrogenase family protein [Streptomyces pacificus]GFH39092.1 acyl-CoA/acyl-ACP dehydrogenase [Streptomyces pacificus]
MSTQPDLLYSEAEDDLRAAVRSLVTDRSDHTAVLDRAESGTPYDDGLWQSLAAGIGAAGLLVPEEFGGQGAGHREAAVVLEELGRTVTPAPYLTGSVIATETLLALAGAHTGADGGGDGGGDGEAAGLLKELAAGRTVAVLVLPLSASAGAGLPTGPTVTGVADAAAADVLLVLRADGLYAVRRGEATVEPLTPLDLTRPLAAVTTAEGSGTRLSAADQARFAVRRGLLAGAGLLASEQLGVAEWCLEETVRYTRDRYQFNRPVGSFQALKHRMAQLWLDVAGARAAARNAADALASRSTEVPLAVSVAQAHCSRVAVRAAEECVQLHAGIGMTWEHPAHLYLKRAKADEIALGTPGHHKEVLAELVSLPGPL